MFNLRPRFFAFIALSLALLASTSVAWAAQTAMLPSACINLSEPECQVVTALFGQAYARASGHQVLPPPAPSPPGAATPEVPPADNWLIVSALRLQQKLHVRASLRTPNGDLIHEVEMTAASLDDLPPVADRMSWALARRTSVDETRSLNTITRTEATRPNRTYSEKVIGFKTGIIKPLSTEVSFGSMISLQFDARFEGDNYFLEFGAGMALPADESGMRNLGGLFAEFGSSLYLGQGNVSPYVGLGISPRLMFTSDDGGVRAAVYGQGGLMFMRFSSTRLYTELRVTQNLISLDVSKYQEDEVLRGGDTVSTYPTEVALQVGIGW